MTSAAVEYKDDRRIDPPDERGAIVGNPELATIYVRYRNYVRHVVARRGVSTADLDDACHDVFVVAGERLSLLREQALLPVWLREIAWRIAMAYRRRASTRAEVFTDAPLELESNTESPEETCLRGELADLLSRALAGLAASERRAATLHLVDELPLAEIARLDSCDRKTARKRVRGAERHIARWIRERPGGEGTPRLCPRVSEIGTGGEVGSRTDMEQRRIRPRIRERV